MYAAPENEADTEVEEEGGRDTTHGKNPLAEIDPFAEGNLAMAYDSDIEGGTCSTHAPAAMFLRLLRNTFVDTYQDVSSLFSFLLCNAAITPA